MTGRGPVGLLVAVLLVVTSASLCVASTPPLQGYLLSYYLSGISSSVVFCRSGEYVVEVDNGRGVVTVSQNGKLFARYARKQDIHVGREISTAPIRNRNFVDKYFRGGLVVENVQSIDLWKDKILFSHIFRNANFFVRVIQVTDLNLKLLNVFDDVILYDAKDFFIDRTSFASEDRVLANGEKGELVKYGLDGRISVRYVVSDSLFNRSRKVVPELYSVEQRAGQPDYSEAKRRANTFIEGYAQVTDMMLAERDTRVRTVVNLGIAGLAKLVDTAAGEKNTAFLLVENAVVHKVDLDNGTVVSACDCRDVLGLSGHTGDSEMIYQMRYVDGRLYFLTKRRVVELDADRKVSRSFSLNGVAVEPLMSWTVSRDPSSRVKLFYGSPREGTVKMVDLQESGH